LYKTYNVKLTFEEPLLGTVPKSERVYTDYIASRVTKRLDEQGLIDPDTAHALASEEIESASMAEEARGWTGFHTDENGPFLYDYQIKGFIKEAGNLIKDFAEVKVKNLRSKLDNYCFVWPRRVRLSDIEPEPLERPLRAMTMQGPRVSLVRSDMIRAGSTIEFQLRVLPSEINKALLEFIFDFGEFKGLGQWRNGSYGRFTYELTEI
jgi:hypothetical protein